MQGFNSHFWTDSGNSSTSARTRGGPSQCANPHEFRAPVWTLAELCKAGKQRFCLLPSSLSYLPLLSPPLCRSQIRRARKAVVITVLAKCWFEKHISETELIPTTMAPVTCRREGLIQTGAGSFFHLPGRSVLGWLVPLPEMNMGPFL